MNKNRFSAIVIGLILILALAACGGARTADASGTPQEKGETESPRADSQTAESSETENTDTEKTLRLKINGTEVAVEWEDNESVSALIDLVSSEGLTVQMSAYGGFEQVGSLGQSLPRNDVQTTTDAGDIVLYSGNQIVVFYGSNSWAYTRLGRISDRSAADMAALLGNGNVTLTITYGG